MLVSSLLQLNTFVYLASGNIRPLEGDTSNNTNIVCGMLQDPDPKQVPNLLSLFGISN